MILNIYLDLRMMVLFWIHDVDDKRDINESKTKDLLVKKLNEFKENNYSLELLSKLCAQEKSSYLGRVLSDYWADDFFDKNAYLKNKKYHHNLNF